MQSHKRGRRSGIGGRDVATSVWRWGGGVAYHSNTVAAATVAATPLPAPAAAAASAVARWHAPKRSNFRLSPSGNTTLAEMSVASLSTPPFVTGMFRELARDVLHCIHELFRTVLKPDNIFGQRLVLAFLRTGIAAGTDWTLSISFSCRGCTNPLRLYTPQETRHLGKRSCWLFGTAGIGATTGAGKGTEHQPWSFPKKERR